MLQGTDRKRVWTAAWIAGLLTISITAGCVLVEDDEPEVSADQTQLTADSSSTTLSGECDEGVTIEIVTDSGATVDSITYPTPTTWEAQISGLADGTNTFTVTATDGDGNSASIEIVVTYSGPTVQEGELLWQFETDGSNFSGGDPAIGPDGTIYFSSGALAGVEVARLYAVSPEGNERWRRDMPTFYASNPVVGDDGTIYIASAYIIYAFSPSGEELWNAEATISSEGPGAADVCDLALGHDRGIFTGHCASGAYPRKFFGFNADDGTMRWRTTTRGEDKIWTTFSIPAVGPDGTVYTIGNNGGETNLIALDPFSGAVFWSVEWAMNQSPSNIAFTPDGYLVVTRNDPDGWVTATVDPVDGSTIAAYPFNNWHTPLIGADGRHYNVGRPDNLANDTHAYWITPDGRILYQTESNSWPHTFTVLGAGNIFFHKNYDNRGGYLQATQNGEVLWTVPAGWGDSAPALAADGTMYITGGQYPGTLSAFAVGTGPETDGWYRRAGNNRNNRRASAP